MNSYQHIFDRYGGSIQRNIEAACLQAAEDLSKIIQFETVNDTEPEARRKFEQQRDACFACLEQMADRLHINFRMPTERVAVIEYGEGEEILGILVHIDVVPAGKGWTHPPFSGTIVDGCVWGRGAQDDKGPLTQFLHALAAVRDSGAPVHRRVRMIIGSEEEGGEWKDIEEYLSMEPAPDFSIVPDSLFPIINGEKGIVTCRLSLPGFDHPLNITDLRFVSLNAGVAVNVVPSEAALDLECDHAEMDNAWKELHKKLDACQQERDKLEYTVDSEHVAGKPATVRITFKGHSAHSSLPYDGHNAAADALAFLVRLSQSEEGEAPVLLEFLSKGADDLQGKYFDIDRLHEQLEETTCSLTMLNLAQRKSSVVFNIRQPFGIEPDEILDNIASRFGSGAKAEHAHRPIRPIWVDPAKQPDFIESLQAAYKHVSGREARLMCVGGTTYAKAMPNALNFGPCDEADGEKELAHQPDERVSLQHLRRNMLIYAHALCALTSDAGQYSKPQNKA